MSRPVSILVCEDDESALEYMLTTLKLLYPACRFLHATDGKDALRHLGRPIDVVVTDLNMPHMDGFELLTELQREIPRIQSVVITAYGEKTVQSKIEGRRITIDHCISKPIDLALLSAALDKCLADIGRPIQVKDGGRC